MSYHQRTPGVYCEPVLSTSKGSLSPTNSDVLVSSDIQISLILSDDPKHFIQAVFT